MRGFNPWMLVLAAAMIGTFAGAVVYAIIQ
jgi:hypothetical protein